MTDPLQNNVLFEPATLDDDEPIGAWALDEFEQFAYIAAGNETSLGNDRRDW